MNYFYLLQVMSNRADDKLLNDNDVLEATLGLSTEMLSDEEESVLLLNWLDHHFISEVDAIKPNDRALQLHSSVKDEWRLIWDNLDAAGKAKVRIQHYMDEFEKLGMTVVITTQKVQFMPGYGPTIELPDRNPIGMAL